MTELISTKLYFPLPRPKLVLHPRLLNKLNGIVYHKLTLISAPAGFGKTTLLTTWHSSLGGDCGKDASTTRSQPQIKAGWVALDKSDNDPIHFWAYFLTALGQLVPGLAQEALLLLQAPQPPSSQIILTRLINNLAQLSLSKQSPLVCVLDDYHLIENEAIHQAMVFLLDHLPPPLHLVILTRTDPPFPLARLRTSGALLELRADQLRFTSAEAAEFLQDLMQLPLSAAQVALVQDHTEGWIAGLQMAALSLQSQPDLAGAIARFSGRHRYVLDYLAEEVLAHLPQSTQTFLVQTAILERFTGPLCEAVARLEPDQGRPMLEQLEAANLFVVPLDQSREWFRYHHLLSGFLQHHLHRLYPAQIPELHRRASQWFVQAGLIPEAIHHALEGQDFEQAAGLIESIAWPVYEKGQHMTLYGWLGKLPRQVLEEHPQLSWWYGWLLLFNGKLKSYAQLVAAAERGWQAANNEQGLAEVYRLRAHAAWLTGQSKLALEHARQALALLPANAPSRRGSCENIVGYSLLMLDSASEAEQILLKVRADTIHQHALLPRLLAEKFLAEVYLAQGRLLEAEELVHQTLVKVAEKCIWHQAWAYTTLGKIYLKQKTWDKAGEWFKQALELPHQLTDEIYLAPVLIGLGRVEAGRGEIEAGLKTLEQAAEVAGQLGHRPYIQEAKAYQARLFLEKGEPDRAEKWAESYYHSLAKGQPGLSYEYEVANLTLTKVWLAQGKFEDAAELIEQLEKSATVQGWAASLAEINLLRQDLEQSKSLVRSVSQTGNSTNSKKDKPGLITPLNEREIEILGLIVAGLSNREIADKLFIALSTVKWYINTIYGKLEVDTRTKAVARARQLKLVA